MSENGIAQVLTRENGLRELRVQRERDGRLMLLDFASMEWVDVCAADECALLPDGCRLVQRHGHGADA